MNERVPPSVAAVICTRGDRPEFLREAIASIVEQDYPGPVEVMVVFDRAEPDESLTEPVAGREGAAGPARRVRVMRNDRAPGLPAGRNAGILATESELVGFCDDDDLWLPDKLTHQVAALRERPRALFASCGAETVYTDRTVTCLWRKPQIAHVDLLHSRIKEACADSFLVRREAFFGPVGLFAEDIPGGFGEDYEMLLRAARHSPIVYVPVVGVRVRVHGRTSHFTGHWATIATACEWLLAGYPEFSTERRGFARIAGQIGIAWGMFGMRRNALRWARRSFLASPLEIRSYVVAALALGLVPRPWVQRRLDAAGATS